MPAAEKEGTDATIPDSREFIHGLKGSTLLPFENGKSFPQIPLKFEGQAPRPTEVEIYFLQMGYLIRIFCGAREYSVPPTIWSLSEDFVDGKSSLEGLLVQVGTYDFDRDGTDEIVIGTSFGRGELHISVIKYFPPSRPEDFGRAGNWQFFGPFHGQFEANLIENAIQLPYGSHGFYWAQGWILDGFVQIEG